MTVMDMPVREDTQPGSHRCRQWQRYFVRLLHGPWAVELVDEVGLADGDRVLDVACGSGAVARAAASRVGAGDLVVGLDLDEQMLAVARTVPAPEGVPIVWRAGAGDRLPFARSSFSAVFCQQGLQFIPGRAEAVAEMRRVLAPAGRLGLNVFCSTDENPSAAAMAEILGRHFGDEVARILCLTHSLGDRDELHALVDAAGFTGVRIRASERTAWWQSPAQFVQAQLTGCTRVALVIPKLEGEMLDTIVADVALALRRFVTPDGFGLPMRSHIVIARVPGAGDSA